jgi:NIPSNAP
MELCCPVIELRQYTLHPGARETLVRVFDEHFLEGQERYGMRIVGQFRDLDDPDRFVWVRGFADMETRTRALEGFYGGPVWKEHGPVANATMIDHTNVLLLRPAEPEAGFRIDPGLRPPHGASESAGGMVVATIHHLAVPASPEVAALLPTPAEPGTPLGRFFTERAPNGYPRLPVRADANAVVTVASYADPGTHLPPASTLPAVSRVEHLRLQPTPRSLMRHRPRS